MIISQQILTRKRYQILYGTTISTLYNTGETNCGNNHFYVARAILLIFCVYQDTESDSCEI